MPNREDEMAAIRRRLGNAMFLIEAQLRAPAGDEEAVREAGEALPSLRRLLALEAELRARAEALAAADALAA